MPAIAISTPVGIVQTPLGPRLPMITMDWVRSRLDLACPMGHDSIEIRVAGLPIAEARNAVVARARELKIKYLFFLDWDVLCPPSTLDRLVYLADNYPDFDIFSGLYCARKQPITPLIWTEWDNGVSWDWTVGDLLNCVGVPTGCMLIRMSLFDRLDGEDIPWFKTHCDVVERKDGPPVSKLITDDLWFCKRAVEEANAKIMLDTALQCGHIDNETGVVYTLPHDCLPWRRWREKQAKKNSNGEARKELANA